MREMGRGKKDVIKKRRSEKEEGKEREIDGVYVILSNKYDWSLVFLIWPTEFCSTKARRDTLLSTVGNCQAGNASCLGAALGPVTAGG